MRYGFRPSTVPLTKVFVFTEQALEWTWVDNNTQLSSGDLFPPFFGGEGFPLSSTTQKWMLFCFQIHWASESFKKEASRERRALGFQDEEVAAPEVEKEEDVTDLNGAVRGVSANQRGRTAAGGGGGRHPFRSRSETMELKSMFVWGHCLCLGDQSLQVEGVSLSPTTYKDNIMGSSLLVRWGIIRNRGF